MTDYFSKKDYYIHNFKNLHYVSLVSLVSPQSHKPARPPYCYHWLGNYKVRYRVTSNGTRFVARFLQIGWVDQNLKAGPCTCTHPPTTTHKLAIWQSCFLSLTLQRPMVIMFTALLEFMLPPPCRWNICPSWTLRSIDW